MISSAIFNLTTEATSTLPPQLKIGLTKRTNILSFLGTQLSSLTTTTSSLTSNPLRWYTLKTRSYKRRYIYLYCLKVWTLQIFLKRIFLIS